MKHNREADGKKFFFFVSQWFHIMIKVNDFSKFLSRESKRDHFQSKVLKQAKVPENLL